MRFDERNTTSDLVKQTQHLANSPYRRLASAIILQAAADWRASRKYMLAFPRLLLGSSAGKQRNNYLEQLGRAKMMIWETEQFFKSEWFMLLTNLDGEGVLRAIKERERNKE